MANNREEMESLKLALKTEKDGRKMYLDAAKKVKNPIAKNVLSNLAEEEVHHINAIENFYRALEEGTEADPDSILKKAHNLKTLKKTIFEQSKDRMTETVEQDPDAIKAYDTAMKFEEDGAAMYKELSGKTGNPKAKAMYSFMFEQESEHYRLLQESRIYLDKPDMWFNEQEKWLFEG